MTRSGPIARSRAGPKCCRCTNTAFHRGVVGCDPRLERERMKERREFITLASRRGHRVAACGGGAAGRAYASHRCALALKPRMMRRFRPAYIVLQALQQLGWKRRPQQCGIRRPIGLKSQCRRHSQALGGIGRARAGRYPGQVKSVAVARVATGDPYRTDRLCYVVRSGRRSSVDSLARPGANLTGFALLRVWAGKWLELLKEVAPRPTRAAVLRDARSPLDRPVRRDPGAALSVGMEVSPSTCTTRGDRACRHGVRALFEWRSDRDGERLGERYRDLSSRWRPGTNCPRSTPNASCRRGGLISYGPDLSTSFGARPAMSIASSRARNPPICRCRRRPNTSW